MTLETKEKPLMLDTPVFTATAELADIAYADLRQVLIAEAGEHELPILADGPDEIRCGTNYGDVGARAAGDGLQLIVSAPSEEWLAVLKDEVVVHLVDAMPALAGRLRWSDAAPAGSLPKNFRLATVIAIEPAGTQFLRVTLQSSDLSAYTNQSIHFRLALPPAGLAEPAWPRLDADGQTVWPEGDKALYRPVYTARSSDAATGRLVFDVFVHDGGRVTEWLRTTPIGQEIGVTGPGGGGELDELLVFLFGDEAAFPAIARILEKLPANAKGEAYLESLNGDAADYPVTAPEGLVLHRLKRGDGPTLIDVAIARMAGEDEGFLWVAAEKDEVNRLRQALAAQLKSRGTRKYVSAYWQR
jgi:NADPH-dependent ferric siderophore reductase